MKLKPIFALSLAAIVSTNCMAIEITKGKLLSHKEWSTGKVSSFSNIITKSNRLQVPPAILNKKVDPDAVDRIYASSQINKVESIAGKGTTISGYAQTMITNGTETHFYDVTTRLCTGKANGNVDDNCVIIHDSFMLDPSGEARISPNPQLTLALDPGYYGVDLNTIIVRDNTNVTFTSYSSNNFNVNAEKKHH